MTSTSAEIVESFGTVHDLRVRPAEPPRLALSRAEQVAVTRLVADDDATITQHVSERATALASDGATRRRSLAKATAVAEAQLAQMTALLADALARRDENAVVLLDRALRGTTKRFCLLVEALRADVNGGRRSVVVVGQADTVHVDAR